MYKQAVTCDFRNFDVSVTPLKDSLAHVFKTYVLPLSFMNFVYELSRVTNFSELSLQSN